jgi:Tol biopolymer transport system component
MTLYIVSAVLFVLGLAAIGGATFGRKRTPRLILAVAGIALWALTLLLYNQAASSFASDAPAPPAAPADATVAPVVQADVATPTATGPDLPGRLAFHSARTGSYEIWTMNGDGSDLRQLTTTGGKGDIEPDWSPDGTSIVFSSSRDDEYLVQLYLMDADGGNQRRLMDPVAADQLGARWSPDGEWIAFYTNVDGNLEVYKVRKDGTDLTNLTNHPNNDYMPYWSPDGARLVFVSERDGNRELYVMDSEGGNQVRLTDSFFDDIYPRWSPDGTTLLFTSTRDGLSNLYAVSYTHLTLPTTPYV